jgi:phosphotransferase system IIB component
MGGTVFIKTHQSCVTRARWTLVKEEQQRNSNMCVRGGVGYNTIMEGTTNI